MHRPAPVLILAVLLLLQALAPTRPLQASPAGGAATPVAAAPAAGGAADSAAVSARHDSTRAGRMAAAGGYQRLLAEGDSLLRLRGGSHAEFAQLYLSWGAPWGMRGARSYFTPACDDTSAVDSLYLSFYPGRSSAMFMGFSGELYFRSATSDTLGPWWHMESKSGENPGNVIVEYGPSPEMPGVQPWTVNGQGLARIDHAPDAMRLRLLYAVSVEAAAAIDSNQVYTLARVLVRHRRSTRLAGCGQPVCVEWRSAKFGFAIKDEPEVRRGERFVGYGGGPAVCAAARGTRAAPWTPKNKPR